MSDFTNLPEDEQNKFLSMMPDYGEVPIEDFRVGFGRRLGAAILDFVIYMIIFMFAMQLFGLLDLAMSIDWQNIMSDPEGFQFAVQEFSSRILPLTLAIGLTYYSMEIFFAATPGKMILGIKIGNANRHIADTKMLATRFAIKNGAYLFLALYLLTSIEIFSLLNTVVSWVIFGGFFAVLAQSKQALHDRFAHTAVYYRDEFIGE